jgi:hypothetical protein
MKKRYLLALISLVLLFTVAATSVFAGYEFGPGAAYTYQTSERKDGALEIKIRLVPLLGSAALTNYEAANAARVKVLLAQGGDPIEVQVTLRHPLGAEEARALVESVGLKVESFLLVGKGADGAKATSIINADLSEVPAGEQGPRGQAIEYGGVMILQGTIAPTVEGLGRLATDDRVYLADTTMIEVAQLVKRDARWLDKPIENISVPSPFWELAWGQQP